MHIDFQDCVTLFDQIIVILTMISIVLVFVCLVGVIKNEQLPDGKKGLLLEVFWPVTAVVTSKYLNNKGKVWRTVLLCSIVVGVISIALVKLNGACQV